MARDNDDLAKSEAEGSDTPIAAQAVEVADFEFNEQNSDVEITPIEAERSGLGDDDTFSAPAAATKVDIARLRKDEDGEQSDDAFGPDDSLTREQVAKMADLAYDLDDADSGSSFPDSDEITSWIEDDTFSAPAAATKVDIARLRKDEDGEQSDSVEKQMLAEVDQPTELINALEESDAAQTVMDNSFALQDSSQALVSQLNQALDASTKQGGATASKGAEVKTELGGEQLAGLTEVDEAEDLNPNDVIES